MPTLVAECRQLLLICVPRAPHADSERLERLRIGLFSSQLASQRSL
ncbi:hypothetical protein M3F56_05385 [Cutibacterium avidum]|nr:hypothetical protein [Cutibacterium avidum]MCT1416265.1 hypothetical protein [Cutibacterium avidum]